VVAEYEANLFGRGTESAARAADAAATVRSHDDLALSLGHLQCLRNSAGELAKTGSERREAFLQRRLLT
jgi:hypothetical protein